MSEPSHDGSAARRLRGPRGLILVGLLVLVAGWYVYASYVTPVWVRDYGHALPFQRAMFGEPLQQPIPFSHRVHATDKEIDCYYCHPFTERSINAGMPTVQTCFGCHDSIIPDHEQIRILRGYRDRGEDVPWVRVYYKPDHVFFPHYRHRKQGVECVECHGEIQIVDRLRQVTFNMGLCLECHRRRGATLECVRCHQ